MKNIFGTFLTIIIGTFGSSISLAQTIVVDPITYEITIIDEETGEELDPDSLDETQDDNTSQSNNTNDSSNTTQTEEEQEDAISNTGTNRTTGENQEEATEDVTVGSNDDEIIETAPTNSNDTLTEFEQALQRMYDTEMTMFNTPESYQSQNFLTREQFTKMINRFYKKLNFPDQTKNNDCEFNDLTIADPTLQPHILETCRIGIFKGYGDNTFRPFKQLTRAEFIAVIMRIYNQDSLDETTFPRWINYFNQAKKRNIIQTETIETMENKITREQTAIYMRRLKQLINSERSTTTTGTELQEQADLSESYILKNMSILGDDINPQNDPQLKEAIHTMYENDMIEIDSINNNFLYANATRAQVAKMLDIFGDDFIDDYPERKAQNQSTCLFNDIEESDENYTYINNICKMGIMVGDNENNFLPNQSMRKSQFITALVRLIEGKLDENIDPWRQNYFEKARQWGIISQEDKESFNREITNVEVILYLHRLIINNVIAQNLDMTADINEFMIIDTVDGQSNVHIDVTFLRNLDNKIGYINRENNKRKVQKTQIQEYPNYHITRYGNIHNTTTNESLGSAMFIVDRKRLLYGNIRFMNENLRYTIQPSKDNIFEYTITESERQ